MILCVYYLFYRNTFKMNSRTAMNPFKCQHFISINGAYISLYGLLEIYMYFMYIENKKFVKVKGVVKICTVCTHVLYIYDFVIEHFRYLF